MKIIIALLLSLTVAQAEKFTLANADRLADAIYISEGGSKTRHPYGILVKYRTTTPRKACLNTIKSNFKRWTAAGSPGDFIDFLAKVYAPVVGASNDPTGLNKNWPKNVRFYYDKK